MKPPLTYKDAGVDIEAADNLVDFIRPLAASTYRKEVAMDIGGFGGAATIDMERYPDPILIASTDGVGTKLRIAFDMDRHETIGIDLVAMCVNDIIVHGAEPLFFLDYFATGKLELERAKKVLQGIAQGCRDARCALIGGETAEMPSFYLGGEYELAGFSVGVVNRDRIINGQEIVPGDVILGLSSNGLHSNGYSLVRKLFTPERGFRLELPLEGFSATLGEELLRPTRIYVRSILALLERFRIKGLAHITGGGLIENIPRILPSGYGAIINPSQWTIPPIFRLLEKEGNLPMREMLRTFNCGVGMAVVVSSHEAEDARRFLEEAGETCYQIGEIISKEAHQDPVVFTEP